MAYIGRQQSSGSFIKLDDIKYPSIIIGKHIAGMKNLLLLDFIKKQTTNKKVDIAKAINAPLLNNINIETTTISSVSANKPTFNLFF